MEVWTNGREILFEQLNEVCDRIGHNISTELNDEYYTRISREELRLLRENSTQVDKLAEHNSRLLEELEMCRVASARVEELEKENQRLASELEYTLKQQNQIHSSVDDYRSKTTPLTSSEPLSSTRNEPNAVTGISRAKHQELIARYNAVCINFKSMKAAKSKLEEIRDADKSKFRKWNSFREEQDARIEKKDERILRLREEIQKLRLQLTEFTGGFEAPLADEAEIVEQSGLNDVRIPRASSDKSWIVGEGSEIEDLEEGVLPLPGRPSDFNPLWNVDDAQLEGIQRRHSSSTNDSDPTREVDLIAGFKQEPSEYAYTPQSSVIVISAKSIRKSRSSAKSSGPKNVVKVEDLGSSPIGLAAIQDLNDSIDLDDIGEKVDTPRKRKRAWELSRGISGFTSSPLSNRSIIRSQAQSSSTANTKLLSEGTPAACKSSVLQPKSINTTILPRTSDDRAYKKRRIANDQAVSSLLEDGELVSSDNAAGPHSTRRLGNLLNTPSPNKQILTPMRLAGPGTQAGSFKTSAPARLAIEVGQEVNPEKTFIAPCVPSTRFDQQERGGGLPLSLQVPNRANLDLLMPSSRVSPCVSTESEAPSSKRRPRVSNVSSESRTADTSSTLAGLSAKGQDPSRLTEFFKKVQAETIADGKFNEANSKFPKSTARLRQNSAELSLPTSHPIIQPPSRRLFRSKRAGTDETDIDPDHEPLRLRPMQSLTIGDFKINPNYNQGFDYAFSEVVRGKDARKCIQGCTKPGCCGYKFRALVEGMTDPNKPLTASQEERDTILLDEFLGRDAYKIQNMSKEERDEMILQAKTREYANKHGKHRHAFEKPSSPPGFWRADMPSTQEEIADRAKAKEKDKKMIEERYREAMRQGGKYMFRDE